ncbi:MAG: serine/threonine protein kinase [Deltaproteobacteria bacterium]|nr:serine/threonine protein kinase [Deltaproteobacteria bacterium]MCW5803758.1 serine/threonine protein kinase [Deltaproteobacteria bacterium]
MTKFTEVRNGTIVGGYRVDALLAEGGMGAVYAASHLVLPRRAAVKVLHPSMMGRARAVERTLQEAQILEEIAGPSVAAIYDAGILADGRPWVAMELLEGATLAAILDERGRLPALEVARVALALAQALARAHAVDVFHRDIKPDNVLVAGERVKLIDWGIARVGNMPRLTDVDSAPGTPQYMSPEQVYGGAIDGRTDVYTLGVVMYELLVGAPPFLGETAVEIALQHVTAQPTRIGPVVPGLPADLDDLILAMRAKIPTARPTIAAVCEKLAELILALSEDYASFEIDVDFDDLEVTQPAAADETDRALAATARIKWTPEVRRLVVRSASEAADVHGEILR